MSPTNTETSTNNATGIWPSQFKKTPIKLTKPKVLPPQESPQVSDLLDGIVVYTTMRGYGLVEGQHAAGVFMQLCGMVGEQGIPSGGEARAVLPACSTLPWYSSVSFHPHWLSCVTLLLQAGWQPSNYVSQSCASADAQQLACHMCWLFELLLLPDNLQQWGEIPSTSAAFSSVELCLPVVNIT